MRFSRFASFFLAFLFLLPLASSFEYEIAGVDGVYPPLKGKAEHHFSNFDSTLHNGLNDFSADLVSMDSVQQRMKIEHGVDLYQYGVDEYLCTINLQQPNCTDLSGSACPNATTVSSYFQSYVRGRILLAYFGQSPKPCTAMPCHSCSAQWKSAMASTLGAAALVIGWNDTDNNEAPCKLPTDTSLNQLPFVVTVLIFNSDYMKLNDALTTIAAVQPPEATGELSDITRTGAIEPDLCEALKSQRTTFFFLVLQTALIPIGVALTIFTLKSKLLPAAEEAIRQQQQQRQNNNNNNQQNQQQQQQQGAQNGEANANAANANPAVNAASPQPTPPESVVILPTLSSSSSSVEEKNASHSFSTPPSAIAIADGMELEEFRSSSSSSRTNTRSLPSSSIDEQALLSSDTLASDAATTSSTNAHNRRRLDVEDFERRSLIESHKRLYGVLDSILAFGGSKSLFYVTLGYNFLLLFIIEIVIIRSRDESCITDLKWMLVYRAGVCFAAVFHAFGQSFSALPSVMRLFFYTRAAGIFFSLMFFTNCVSLMIVRRNAELPEHSLLDCDDRAPVSSTALFIIFYVFLAGGALLILMRLVDKAYTACTKQRTAVAPPWEGLLVLFGRALRKHALSGCVIFGPLDQPEPVTTLQLSLLPTTTYRVGMYDRDDAVCPICLSEYEAGERLRILPGCFHHYHAACLDQWITSQKPTCPTCRRPIPLSYQQYEDERIRIGQDANVAGELNERRDDRRRDGRMPVPVEDI